MVKRTFDFIHSLLGLLLLSPVLLLIGIVIKLDSRGPVFYRGARVGRYGREFRLFKFRTMVVNADKIGGPSSANDDPRITRLGRFLRRYKLDELPQLINVVLGDMSLVGPRPEVPQYVALFDERERAILSVKPGITDWASIWNSDEGSVLAGAADPERVYMEQIRPHKIRLQLQYVAQRSFWVDLMILAQTLKVVLFREPPAQRTHLQAGGRNQ